MIKIPIFRREDGFLDAVPGNYAVLDENGLMDIETIYPFVEEYFNYEGEIDNFFTTILGGTGSVTGDSTNHEIDIATGVTAASSAILRTKDIFTLSSKPIIINMKISNLPDIVFGAGNNSEFIIGLSDTDKLRRGIEESFNAVAFHMYSSLHAVEYETITITGSFTTERKTISLSVNDLLTIVAYSNYILFYKNGILVNTHTQFIPSSNLYLWTSIINDGDANDRHASVDYLNLKKYK